jgi:hypothetical protein
MVDRRLVWLIVLAAVLFAVIVLANQQLRNTLRGALAPAIQVERVAEA